MDAFCSQLFEAFVELLSCAAELRVIFVAEREHGVTEVLQLRRGIGADVRPEVGRVVRRIPIAPGAGDDDGASLLSKIELRGGIEFHDARCEAFRRRFFRKLLRETFGRSALAAVENEERLGRRRRGGLARRPWLAEVGVGEEPGEVAVEPGTLLRREGRAAGNVGNARHQRWSGSQFINSPNHEQPGCLPAL